MISQTKAIVLSTIKYGEADLIVKCYTQFGVKSYLLKRVLKAKKSKIKASYFQPLTQLELIVSHNDKGNLNYIREVNLSRGYQTIHTNIIKQTIAIFLSEVLAKSLYEEEGNDTLFEYLETALAWFDTHELAANFHLLFLVNLSKHLGFYPDKDRIQHDYFDLFEGVFSNYKPRNQFITGDNLVVFKALLGINFDALHKVKLNAKKRQEILEILIQYFELHLPMFQKPKSLAILKTVFV